MTRTYKPRTVQAEQFVVNEQPWPEGVAEASDCISGYMFAPTDAAKVPISPGDYIVTRENRREVVRSSEFEEQYELP